MINAQQDGPDLSTGLDAAAPVSQVFRDAVSERLEIFLDEQAAVLEPMGAELLGVQRMARELLTGGKRLRPAFCYWGYVAAAGCPDTPGPLLSAAASLDLLHVSALVHDDVMDASDLRRGRPAAHRQFEALHTSAGWLGDPETFGRAGAILLGDLLVMWSVEMLQRAGLPDAALRSALPLAQAMRTEVTCGQYLDVLAQVHPLRSSAAEILGGQAAAALADANRVVEYKSARYTVQRPCQFGAALGGADERVQAALAAYGSPLGRAFQFRDDLLGVFGDPLVTGKPTGDDLREGKRTVLIAHAYAASTPVGQELLVRLLGDPALDEDGITLLHEVIISSGARDAVESMIEDGYQQALSALEGADLTDPGRTALTELATAAVRRSF
ncbi:MAG: geranylgeranyl diphosphate synthase, type [Propionibacteriaceae bacterium]|nr:polyprenyl synthetase family protein [Propionibacteriaceae bacterium]MDX6320988.1 geranylgeranyl diphosphate synthase, type [Propionibacteriaceae bacterium]